MKERSFIDDGFFTNKAGVGGAANARSPVLLPLAANGRLKTCRPEGEPLAAKFIPVGHEGR
jgi:hypothetical protein